MLTYSHRESSTPCGEELMKSNMVQHASIIQLGNNNGSMFFLYFLIPNLFISYPT